MTTYSLTLRQDHFESLRAHLIQPDGYERAGYLLCREACIAADPWDRQAHRKFLSCEVRLVPVEDVVESTPGHITWRTRSFVAALKAAIADGMTLAVIHSHPHGVDHFSGQDDRNEPDLVQLAVNRNGPGTEILSLVMAFNRPEAGAISIDGADLTSLRLRDYRAQLGIVLQDNFLFDGTVADNISFSRPGATR